MLTAGGICALLLSISAANIATAKGPIPAPPPVSISLYTQNYQDINLTQAQATAIGSLMQSVPLLYNASWKPAIHDLALRSNQTLVGQWMDQIRLDISQQSSGQYLFTVYFGTISNGSAYERIQRSYPVDQTVSQILTNLHASVGVVFSVYGPYLTSQAEDEFFFTDQYFKHFDSVAGKLHRA